MRTTLFVVLAISLFGCSANKNVYRASDFAEKAASHQTIAVLPVYITQAGHKIKNVSEEEAKASNVKWGYVFQESLQLYLIKHTSKNRKGKEISFQSLQKTNALLKENRLEIETAYKSKPEELAKILGVDAVLMTTLVNQKNFGDGLAYELAIGKGILITAGQGDKSSASNHNATDISMNSFLYDGGDSKLLWKTYRKGGTDLPSRVNDLIAYYSNWIAKKFPYKG